MTITPGTRWVMILVSHASHNKRANHLWRRQPGHYTQQNFRTSSDTSVWSVSLLKRRRITLHAQAVLKEHH